MTAKEVEGLSERHVTTLDSPRAGATHQIGAEGETTQTWLIFKEDKLQSIQLAWMYRLKRLATAQRVEIVSRMTRPV